MSNLPHPHVSKGTVRKYRIVLQGCRYHKDVNPRQIESRQEIEMILKMCSDSFVQWIEVDHVSVETIGNGKRVTGFRGDTSSSVIDGAVNNTGNEGTYHAAYLMENGSTIDTIR